MRRIFLFLWNLLVVAASVCAQDFDPGTQAKGYLSRKNVTVDYATGIFHYRIPLFTIGQGSVILPVSLDYTGNGIKDSDNSGLIGYNWTLNTGGVVTRTIRGGIADEDRLNGFLVTEKDSVSLWNDAVAVNKRERDGECDIFTVVFNGRSLHFILRMDAEGKIFAQPLEQTQVKIECETDVRKEITGWIVTDESGNRYIYRQVAWSSDIVDEEAVSFNGVRGKDYISSWYLSRIEPYNGEVITYHYREDVRKEGDQKGIFIAWEGDGWRAKYDYGRPIEEHPFDFSKYKLEFDSYINEAKAHLQGFSFEQQINNPLYIFINNSNWIRNPNFEAGAAAISANFRIMGQLSNFESIGKPSSELISVLNRLYDMYRNQSSSHAQMAAGAFRGAKSLVINCLNEVQQVSSKEVEEGKSYAIRTPLLDYIVAGEEALEFYYSTLAGTCELEGIRQYDVRGELLSEVNVSAFFNLSLLEFRDKDSVVVSKMSFDYHTSPGGNIIYDLWGYNKNSTGEEDEEYSMRVNEDYAKWGALKTIHLPDGGDICIDYESNQINLLSTGTLLDYGGIRLKHLVFNDPKQGTSDTIHYRYPSGGMPVSTYSNSETVRYSGFSDDITYSRMRPKGAIFVATGNNGLYYRYVQEIMPGQGMRAYLFYTKDMMRKRLNLNLYWKLGLPLATADYDEGGHLKRLTKNLYYVNQLPPMPGFIEDEVYDRDYFTVGDSSLFYDQYLPQLQAYEYYIDRKSVGEYYKNQDKVLLYRDNNSYYYIIPYNNVYVPNILPRTNAVGSMRNYTLFYGGKVLLKSQQVYNFNDTIKGLLTEEDFEREDEGMLDLRTEYFYDHLPSSLFSTRKTVTDSRGGEYMETTKRVCDMADAAMPAVAAMKAVNLISPVVKTELSKDSVLLSAQVNLYELCQSEETEVAVLSEQKAYFPMQAEFSDLTFPDATLFSYGEENYIRQEKRDYGFRNALCLPTDVQDRTSRTALLYDASNRPILKASEVNHQEVAAVNAMRNIDYNDAYYQYCQDIQIFCGVVPEIVSSPIFEDYINTVDYYWMDGIFQILSDYTLLQKEVLAIRVDSVLANNERYLSSFQGRVLMWFSRNPYDMEVFQGMMKLSEIIRTKKILEDDFLRTWSLVYYSMERATEDFRLTLFPSDGKLRMYVLHWGYTNATYVVEHAEGSTTKSVSFEGDSHYKVDAVDVDLSEYDDVLSVSLKDVLERTTIPYAAIVPKGTIFEATCYHADGRVFAEFDQSGQLRVYDYDGAGRVIKVLDGEGNILSAYEYHQTGL